MVSISRWREQYPMAAAWIFSCLLYSVAMTIAIMRPFGLNVFLPAAVLDAWPAQHPDLNHLLGGLLLVFIVSAFIDLLAPQLTKPDTWPEADQAVRAAIEQCLARIPAWRIFAVGLGAEGLLYFAVGRLAEHMPWVATAGTWTLTLTMMPLYFFMFLRPNRRDQNQVTASDTRHAAKLVNFQV